MSSTIIVNGILTKARLIGIDVSSHTQINMWGMGVRYKKCEAPFEAVKLFIDRHQTVAASVPDTGKPRRCRGVSLRQTDLRQKFTASLGRTGFWYLTRFFAGLLFVAWMACLPGCLGSSEQEIVVYAALDREFSEPILKDFEQETGIRVFPKYDQESNKTVGLANEIINQQQRQRTDLFWNNEILHTLRLKKLGLLDTYDSPEAAHYPAAFVSADHDWHGFAARARVLIVNTDLLPDAGARPNSILDLADSKWKGKCAIARPLFGTTATHAAVLFSVWGEERAQLFFRQIANNAVVESGNKQVAQKVAQGRYLFGVTDTDDAIIELERGAPVAIVFPDQAAGQMGALLIPNTLCIIKNGPNSEHARKLVDYLLRAKVEERLAAGASAQIPLNSQTKIRSRVVPQSKLRIMPVDFQAAADKWDTTARFLEKTFPVAGN